VCVTVLATAAARAEDVAVVCLTSGDAAEMVASRRVIAPQDAMVAARHAIPSGDILRASLCRKEDDLVYRLTAIRPDGRVVRVTIDAPSGKVRNLH
jgi:uncharacterized membrane protein YkoI